MCNSSSVLSTGHVPGEQRWSCYFPGRGDGIEIQKSQSAAGAVRTQGTLHRGVLHGPEVRKRLRGESEPGAKS